jgi:hypothetical protein
MARSAAWIIESIPLLGPRSAAAVQIDAHGVTIDGEWQHLRFHVALVLARSAPAWLWHVAVENAGARPASVDLIYAQDLALADYGPCARTSTTSASTSTTRR